MNLVERNQSDPTSMQFLDWYKAAKPQDVYTYYIGSLGLDDKVKLIGHVKHLAWEYAVKGRVFLLQRKVVSEIDVYEYIAIKSRYFRPDLVPLDYLSERYVRIKPRKGR